MGGCHDVFVIDNRRAAVEFALVREHGHPRVLMHVRGGATDDSVFLTQSPASLNKNKNIYKMKTSTSRVRRYKLVQGEVFSRFSTVITRSSWTGKHRGPPCIVFAYKRNTKNYMNYYYNLLAY